LAAAPEGPIARADKTGDWLPKFVQHPAIGEISPVKQPSNLFD